MTLNSNQRTLLASASREAVRDKLNSASQNWARRDWLGPRNRYRNECIERLSEDSKPQNRFYHKSMGEYIAASCITHCFDGWAYFSRAISAMIFGDVGGAHHLGYYAELRAAMSLLASEGIGIFSSKHIVITRNGRCKILSGNNIEGRRLNTHVIAWEALEHWANSGRSANTVLQVVKPGGVLLSDWFNHFSSGATHIIAGWLTKWGLDLKRFTKDKEARHHTSYRPTDFNLSSSSILQDAIDNLREIWVLCEPSSAGTFPTLDRQLLKQSLEQLFKFSHSHRRTRNQASLQFQHRIEATMRGISPRELSRNQWIQFLTDSSSDTCSKVLTNAAGQVGPIHQDHLKQTLSRALLLLRISTGSAQEMLHSITSCGRSDLEFWWSRIGVDRGLWEDENPPSTFADLWRDIREALDDLERWRRSDGPSLSRNSLLQNPAAMRAAAVLGSAERNAFWGLGL